MIARRALPAGRLELVTRTLPVQHLQRRLARAFVVVQPATGRQRDQGLAQRMLVAAVDGVCATAAVAARAFSRCCRASAVSEILFIPGASLQTIGRQRLAIEPSMATTTIHRHRPRRQDRKAQRRSTSTPDRTQDPRIGHAAEAPCHHDTTGESPRWRSPARSSDSARWVRRPRRPPEPVPPYAGLPGVPVAPGQPVMKAPGAEAIAAPAPPPSDHRLCPRSPNPVVRGGTLATARWASCGMPGARPRTRTDSPSTPPARCRRRPTAARSRSGAAAAARIRIAERRRSPTARRWRRRQGGPPLPPGYYPLDGPPPPGYCDAPPPDPAAPLAPLRTPKAASRH